MKNLLYIGLLILSFSGGIAVQAQESKTHISFDFFGEKLETDVDEALFIPFEGPLTQSAIRSFNRAANQSDYQPLIDFLKVYRDKKMLDDWLFYQLVRSTAQQIAPKAENYYRYTLFKWFLMTRSGYDARLTIYNDEMLFYIYSTDEVFGLPLYVQNGRQYVCLNIHDYAKASNQQVKKVYSVDIEVPEAVRSFSYKVTRLPEFKEDRYAEREIRFSYRDSLYNFLVKVNPEVQKIFTNYPVVDYGSYFNIPLSGQTYRSLVPLLQKQVKDLKVKQGIDYLMHFTRYAFLYEDDQQHFGKEKRMSPEETLLSSASDCDDRAALFFYLVKEIYNLPMVALVYPSHITIAVQFEKPFGKTIEFEGKKYSICEPTPQAGNLGIGEISPKYRHLPYQVVYAYNPKK